MAFDWRAFTYANPTNNFQKQYNAFQAIDPMLAAAWAVDPQNPMANNFKRDIDAAAYGAPLGPTGNSWSNSIGNAIVSAFQEPGGAAAARQMLGLTDPNFGGLNAYRDQYANYLVKNPKMWWQTDSDWANLPGVSSDWYTGTGIVGSTSPTGGLYNASDPSIAANSNAAYAGASPWNTVGNPNYYDPLTNTGSRSATGVPTNNNTTPPVAVDPSFNTSNDPGTTNPMTGVDMYWKRQATNRGTGQNPGWNLNNPSPGLNPISSVQQYYNPNAPTV